LRLRRLLLLILVAAERPERKWVLALRLWLILVLIELPGGRLIGWRRKGRLRYLRQHIARGVAQGAYSVLSGGRLGRFLIAFLLLSPLHSFLLLDLLDQGRISVRAQAAQDTARRRRHLRGSVASQSGITALLLSAAAQGRYRYKCKNNLSHLSSGIIWLS
jgi:hypothetical protein